MSSYSGIERKLARFLANFPILKKVAKLCYSRFVYIRFRQKDVYRSKYEVSGAYLDRNEHSFFGYYDKSPLNKTTISLPFLSKVKPPPSTTIAYGSVNFLG